jgi:hypothetical protein
MLKMDEKREVREAPNFETSIPIFQSLSMYCRLDFANAIGLFMNSAFSTASSKSLLFLFFSYNYSGYAFSR